jgi:hypothetical protein
LESLRHHVPAVGLIGVDTGTQHLFGMRAQVVEESALVLCGLEARDWTMPWNEAGAGAVAGEAPSTSRQAIMSASMDTG